MKVAPKSYLPTSVPGPQKCLISWSHKQGGREQAHIGPCRAPLRGHLCQGRQVSQRMTMRERGAEALGVRLPEGCGWRRVGAELSQPEVWMSPWEDFCQDFRREIKCPKFDHNSPLFQERKL